MYHWSLKQFFGMISNAIITADLGHVRQKFLKVNLTDGTENRLTL